MAYGEANGEAVLDSIYYGKPPEEVGLDRVGPRRIISNVFLNFDHTHFDIAYFLEHLADSEMENCAILWDETYQLADSRNSATKLNKIVTYFVVQTRKRGVDLILCTHNLDHLDLRIRRAVDVRGTCRTWVEMPCRKCKGTREYKGQPCDRCLGYGKKGVTTGYFLNKRLRRRSTLDLDPANTYWHLFNTKERIPMQARMIANIDTALVV